MPPGSGKPPAAGNENTPSDVGSLVPALADGRLADLTLRALGLCDPVYIASADGVIVYANPAFAEIFRRSDGKPIRKLNPRLLSTLRRAEGPVRQKETLSVDDRVRTLSGRHVKVPDPATGDVTLVGVYEDQTVETELKTALSNAKERSDELLSTVSDWVWQTDGDWSIVHSVTRDVVTDGNAGAEILGRSLFDLGHFEKQGGRRPPTTRTRAPFRDAVFVTTSSSGASRTYLLSGIPIFDPENGGFQGFRGSGTDVTDRLAAEHRAGTYRQELERALSDLTATNTRLDSALAQAREADRAKSRFLGMIGHELRTPLNAIIGFSEIMNNELFGPLGQPEYKGYSGDVLASGRHLLSVINDILDVVKLEAGEMTVQADRFDAARAVEAAVRLVSLQAEAKQIVITHTLSGDFPALYADEQKVRQMIINLLSNAIKFTPAQRAGQGADQGPNRGQVTIDGRRSADGEAILSVQDNGIGIDTGDIETLLLPFKQADDRISRSFEGTGLGLPLTRALIELHGGRLEIDSTLGAGTTVSLIFPQACLDDHQPVVPL